MMGYRCPNEVVAASTKDQEQVATVRFHMGEKAVFRRRRSQSGPERRLRVWAIAASQSPQHHRNGMRTLKSCEIYGASGHGSSFLTVFIFWIRSADRNYLAPCQNQSGICLQVLAQYLPGQLWPRIRC